jgi:hypothetical protein
MALDSAIRGSRCLFAEHIKLVDLIELVESIEEVLLSLPRHKLEIEETLLTVRRYFLDWLLLILRHNILTA